MEFMELWEQGRFDLIQFTIGQRKKLHNTFKELRKIEIAHDVTQEPGDFIKMCNNGSITEEDFLSYGPHLAVRWLHAQQDRGRNKQRELDEEQEAVEQAETEYQAMKKAVDIPNEDPFEVKVDYPVMYAINLPLDGTLPPPEKIKPKATQDDTGRSWADTYGILDAFFNPVSMTTDQCLAQLLGGLKM